MGKLVRNNKKIPHIEHQSGGPTMNLFNAPTKPIKIWAVIAYTEECSFVARCYRYKCEAQKFAKIGDGNPYVCGYGIEEVMLY